MINNVNFKIGEIFIGKNNLPIDGNHYIVFFEDIDGSDFQGCMISTKPFYGINLKMNSSHFEVINKITNQNWLIAYNNSYLVPAKLHKLNEMGEFEKVGQLTEEGISFLKTNIAEKDLIPWEVYKFEVHKYLENKYAK